jgi:hypothetical protein
MSMLGMCLGTGAELSQFQGYYDHCGYLPLDVFGGQAMPACLSRPSRIDGARHAAAVIELIVTRLRHTGPDVRIIVSGDSDLARQRLNRWCGRAGFGYVIGIARHARRQGRLAAWEAALKVAYLRDGTRAAHDPRQAAQVRRSDSVYTRRVRVLLASHHPVRDADLTAVRALVPCPGRLRSRHVDASGGRLPFARMPNSCTASLRSGAAVHAAPIPTVQKRAQERSR